VTDCWYCNGHGEDSFGIPCDDCGGSGFTDGDPWDDDETDHDLIHWMDEEDPHPTVVSEEMADAYAVEWMGGSLTFPTPTPCDSCGEALIVSAGHICEGRQAEGGAS